MMRCQRMTLAAIVWLILPSLAAARGQSLSMTAALGSAYDDNFLQYSAGQISDFEAGLKPAQFSIATRDDQLWLPSLAFAFEADRGHGHRSELTVRGSGEYHQKNGTADHGSGSVSWRESFGAGRRLTLSAYRLPGFYLRQLLDDDAVNPFPGLSKYRRAEFDLTTLAAKYRQRVVEGFSVEAGYQHEQRDYVPDFAERTSSLQQGSLAFDCTAPKNGAFGAGVSYQSSTADAKDDDVAATPFDDVDVSYHGLEFDAGARWRFVHSPSHILEGLIALQSEGRTYDSDRVTDKYHHGRSDRRLMIEPALRIGLRKQWSARVAYMYEKNDARLGTAAPASADAGSYVENRVTFTLEWNHELWHSRHATAGE